jgi:hypothetical protein
MALGLPSIQIWRGLSLSDHEVIGMRYSLVYRQFLYLISSCTSQVTRCLQKHYRNGFFGLCE